MLALFLSIRCVPIGRRNNEISTEPAVANFGAMQHAASL